MGSMASLIARNKANTLYCYVVESARVDGKPRIVHQSYLETAERVAALIKASTAPVPSGSLPRHLPACVIRTLAANLFIPQGLVACFRHCQ